MNKDEFDFTDSKMLRKKAEKILKEKKEKAELKHLESDLKKLLHELQVHQIELEMQNEELQQAYELAEKALKKYTLLYDFAPMGYLTISADGTIHDVNFSAADMIGERRRKLIDTNFKRFIANDSIPVFNGFLEKILADSLKHSCIVSLGIANNHSIRVFMEGLFIAEDNTCILSFLDISNLKKQ
jgi:PAS domain-containing protein